MGNFLTRMVERSNATAHVVQPLIAPLYAAASDQMANRQQSEGVVEPNPPGDSIDRDPGKPVLPNSTDLSAVVPDADTGTTDPSFGPARGSRQRTTHTDVPRRPEDGSTDPVKVVQSVENRLPAQPIPHSRQDHSAPGDSSTEARQISRVDSSARERVVQPRQEEAPTSQRSEPAAKGPDDQMQALPEIRASTALHRISAPRHERAVSIESVREAGIDSLNDSDDEVPRPAEQRIQEESDSDRPSIVPPHLLISSTQPVRNADMRSRREPEGERDPVIRVTIGRVEVRAVMPSPPPAPPRPVSSRGPQLTLAEYLKRSNGGSE